MTDLKRAVSELRKGGSFTLSSVPEGFDAFCVADLAHSLARDAEKRAVVFVHVARDETRVRAFNEALAFAAPDIEVIDLPGWDCQPYDRVSPNASISARRMTALARLARSRSSEERPRILSTTVAAVLQKVPPLTKVAQDTFSAAPGNAIDMDKLVEWLEINGFVRSATVRDTGEYAVRGGILDLFAPALAEPIRLDFFGDTLESIRTFDPETQRTVGQLKALDLVPMSEVQLTTAAIKRFRQAYTSEFGGQTRGDVLYEAISEGRRSPGLEHWLPLFYDNLDPIFAYTGDAPLVLDPSAREAASERLAQIEDYYDARKSAHDKAPAHSSYKPLAPGLLYLDEKKWLKRLEEKSTIQVVAGAHPEGRGLVIDAAGHTGRNFAPERADEGKNVFAATVEHVRALQEKGRHVILAAWSDGSRERLAGVLADHDMADTQVVASLSQVLHYKRKKVCLAVFGLEQGFEAGDIAVVSEQDILGDRLVRKRKNAKRAQNFISEIGSISAGDIVVHADHGIARFHGLEPIEAGGVRHDCLELHYADNVKLYLPVENLELLSRYGSEDTEVQLDRLGGASWQKRKARMRKRVLEMAAGLIKIAAARATSPAPKLAPPDGLYAEFCAGFPYDETEDQGNAIDATLEDLAAGHPMDRLICGDVGFGKTEVAMRAAFACAINGKQVAVVVPTTLLARQHFRNFSERFAHLPIKVMQISRMATAPDLRVAKAGVMSGDVDIVVGTHAVLGAGVSFKDLGLVIVDEEQHFGVKHKERLKDMRAEVHVLTLSATPIPRTLQLAMTGVHDLSIIATPPVDRLAVRTFVTPFDELLVREALLRERYRGGQSFYVCPRIEHIDEALAFLRNAVPEAKIVVAHGQMPPTELEDKMAAFYEGKFDILLSTSIVESGLDIPRANTLIVHRADMFGPLAAIPAARSRRPLQDARLRVVHLATQQDGDGAGGEAAEGAGFARHARRRLPAGEPRPRHPRRRQPARRRTVRPYQGGRLRTLSGDAGRGDRGVEARHCRRAAAGGLVAADPDRHAGHDPGGLCRGCAAACAALPPSRDLGDRRRDRGLRRRADRSLRPAAARGRPPDEARLHQAAVPPGSRSEGRRRPQGPRAGLPRELLRQPAGAGALRHRAGCRRQGAAGHEGRLRARL